jgi:HAD superfamily hydrolase (TIGR01549 family)
MFEKIKNIFWDFDGVLIDSNDVRTNGFREIFHEYPKNLVDQLIEYHVKNGGLSRYDKVKYFYEKILTKSISETQVVEYSNSYKSIMLNHLLNKKYLINDSLNFIKKNQSKNMFLVSASDEKELKTICEYLGLKKYFIEVKGSPTTKKENLENLLIEYNLESENSVLIGDSFNDYEAAISNGINFYGYNNKLLRSYDYIEKFQDLEI